MTMLLVYDQRNDVVRQKNIKETTQVDKNIDTVPIEKEIAFPLSLEDGKLEIDSLFQFDGINPDCDNQEDGNIASISLTNHSDNYLESAEIEIYSNSGKKLQFVVKDIPAGKKAMAFATDNTTVETDESYGDVTCEVIFNEEASINEEKVSFSVEGTQITLKNKTNVKLNNLVVYCHSTLGDQYFGGITYIYNINELAENETIAIDATDCILGLAEVVRIEVDE